MGVMESRCLGADATQALVAAVAARDAASKGARLRSRSLMPPDLEQRLARLGIGAGRSQDEVDRRTAIIDMPL
jgi:hypothetical protein